MSLQNIVEDNYGMAMELTIVQDNEAKDISAFGTVGYIFSKPDNTVITKVGAKKSGGTDGVVTYTIDQGLFDTIGRWMVQVVLSDTGISVSTVRLPFDVKRKIQ